MGTDMGGNRELVMHGKSGFLVPATNPNAMASYATLDEPAAGGMVAHRRAWARVLSRIMKKTSPRTE